MKYFIQVVLIVGIVTLLVFSNIKWNTILGAHLILILIPLVLSAFSKVITCHLKKMKIFDGRMNRLDFVLRIFFLSFIVYFMNLRIEKWVDNHNTLSYEGAIGMLIFGFILFLGWNIIQASFIVKRLHDIERPGYDFFLLLIPFYNIYLTILLFLKKGTNGLNPYGNPTSKKVL
jgi:uncharacterized membrane protein YhaH (DUF805 family)